MEQLRDLTNVVRNSVVDTALGTGDVLQAVTESVSHSLITVLDLSGSAGDALLAAVSEVACGAMHGAAEAGSDLGTAARGAMIGTIRATHGAAGGPIAAIGASAENMVNTAARIGDGASAARGALQGAVVGASAAGINALDALADAAGGAVRGGFRAGADVAGIARSAVEGAVWGAQDLGVDAGQVAAAAAGGALRAASSLGSATLAEVRGAMRGPIAGVAVTSALSRP